jgi:Fur family ferric uptake transcriptional regulator
MRYNTKQRELILECLSNSNGAHIKVDDILDYLKAKDTPVGKSTVYRYLDTLTEQNVIRKYTVEEGTGACYQYIGGQHQCHEHYHLKCSVCGELFHVSCSFMDEITKHILEEHEFIVDNSKTVFYGICKVCRNYTNA